LPAASTGEPTCIVAAAPCIGCVKEGNRIIWGTRSDMLVFLVLAVPPTVQITRESSGVHKRNAPSYVKSLNLCFNYFSYALACRLRKEDNVAILPKKNI
jgi:hypothetical protein